MSFMTFSVERLEFYALIFIRVTMLIATAPIFNMNYMPRKFKTGICLFLSLVLFPLIPYSPLQYNGVIGYTMLVVREAMTGALLGLASGLCMYILDFSGHLIDMEIGFSMVTLLDPATNTQTSITGSFLGQLVMLMLLVTDFHYFLIDTMVDSFSVIPLGGANFSGKLYLIYADYMTNYFIIGFRIILPIFASILVVNIVLGVLAKVAPQMNMFAIGMQLKVFVGLFIMTILVTMLPGITDFLFIQMKTMTSSIVKALMP